MRKNNHLTKNTQLGYFVATVTKVAVGIHILKRKIDAQSHLMRLFLCPCGRLLYLERLCGRAVRLADFSILRGNVNPTHVCHPLVHIEDDRFRTCKIGDITHV